MVLPVPVLSLSEEEDNMLSRSTIGTELTETSLTSTIFQPLSEDKWYRLTPEQRTSATTVLRKATEQCNQKQNLLNHQPNKENQLRPTNPEEHLFEHLKLKTDLKLILM